jgi:hypothetical protein
MSPIGTGKRQCQPGGVHRIFVECGGAIPEKEDAVKESFDEQKREMDEACEFMRSFTLGRPGFTRQDGGAAISRLGDLCERMQKDFGSGTHEKETVNAVTSARGQIVAAKARLDLLGK